MRGISGTIGGVASRGPPAHNEPLPPDRRIDVIATRRPRDPKTGREGAATPRVVGRPASARRGPPASAATPTIDKAKEGRSGMSTPVMIEADGLCKQFGSFLAVRDVTFSIPQGQVVAFLGPNGAGKSTTMRLLTGFMAPTRGGARIAGIDVQADRIAAAERLGYLPENGPLYTDMTPLGLLGFFGSARGMSGARLRDRIAAVVDLCALDTVAHKPIGKLSKGYRQRVSMAQAILHDPEVLILDEPTSGLDPNQIRGVRALIRELGKTKTVLVSTHILQEVEPVAGRVLFIHDGKIVFDGSPAELAGRGGNLEEAFHRLTAQPV
jgi:ABC-2 type transport system ATP-binding protein